MFYRRILPVASVAVIAGGIFSLNFPGSGSHYKGARLSDHGLKNYTFVDSRKFELINACVLTRHGARTPNYYIDSKYEMPDWTSGLGYVNLLPDLCYSTDVKELPGKLLIDEESIQEEYIQHNKGKCNYGQLTLIGQEQSIHFGKELRRIYMMGNKLINEEFNENEILSRSTKFPRTFYTLKGILSGLYGVDTFDLCHRPIIYTMPIAMDTFYPNPSACSVVGEFTVSGSKENSNDSEIMKMKCILKRLLGVQNLRFANPNNNKVKSEKPKKCSKNKEKNKEISTQLIEKQKEESTDDNDVTVYAIRDDLYSRQVHNYEVPSAFTSMFSEINRLSSQEILYEYLGGSTEWEERISLIVSPTINFIKDNMKKVADESLKSLNNKSCIPDMKSAISKKKGTMKMQLLSCHDTTLIPLLVCMRIYDGQWPVFMSNLIIELYKEKESNKLFTRVLYQGKVQKLNLHEETCGVTNEYEKQGLLPYDDFIQFLNKYSIPDDHYGNSCDKAMRLFKSGKPVSKDQYI
uniref:2-phosphoxylose phosphatase 1 n=1 Tax=Dugesia japonica TaxID=6161 RepID=A0A6B9CTV4_DUGJA|nr:acid phosphatase type 6 [Dugesia japonica]